MLKTTEPQGQVCSGPSVLRSEPKTSGSLCLLKIGKVGRRKRTVCFTPHFAQLIRALSPTVPAL